MRSLLEDQSGLLWVGTSLGGVTIVNPRPSFGVERVERRAESLASGHHYGLPAPMVRAFLEDSARHACG